MRHHPKTGMMMVDGGVEISNGSIFDYPCTTLPDIWALTGGGNSTETEATEEGENTYLLDSGASYNASNQAQFNNTAAFTAPASPTTIYISKRIKLNRLGSEGVTRDDVQAIISYSSTHSLFVRFWDDKFGVQDGAGVLQYTAWTPVYDTFFWLNFVVNNTTKKCDVKLNNDIIITGADCSRALAYTGRWTSTIINRQPSGYSRTLCHIDRLLVGTGTQQVSG